MRFCYIVGMYSSFLMWRFWRGKNLAGRVRHPVENMLGMRSYYRQNFDRKISVLIYYPHLQSHISTYVCELSCAWPTCNCWFSWLKDLTCLTIFLQKTGQNVKKNYFFFNVTNAEDKIKTPFTLQTEVVDGCKQYYELNNAMGKLYSVFLSQDDFLKKNIVWQNAYSIGWECNNLLSSCKNY